MSDQTDEITSVWALLVTDDGGKVQFARDLLGTLVIGICDCPDCTKLIHEFGQKVLDNDAHSLSAEIVEFRITENTVPVGHRH